jgi:hypothetical protein
MMAARTRALVASLALVAGCGAPDGDVAVPEADAEAFAEVAYPILLANCAFPVCHGAPDRPFRVVGPGRTRLSPDSAPEDPATAEELALSYARARSMLVGPDGVRRAPLLRKPLAIAAGGAGHEGDDPWGQAIFGTKKDPRFVALFRWATAGGGEP